MLGGHGGIGHRGHRGLRGRRIINSSQPLCELCDLCGNISVTSLHTKKPPGSMRIPEAIEQKLELVTKP